MRSMRSIFKILSVAISFIALSGCATQARLVVMSQPEGAYITRFDGTSSFGMAPAYMNFDSAALLPTRDSGGCYIIRGFEARWVSGASASINPIRLCGSNTGSYSITLSRDPSKPDLDKDLEFALKAQTLRAQQQRAQAADDAASAALWSAWANTQKNTVNCTTTELVNENETPPKRI